MNNEKLNEQTLGRAQNDISRDDSTWSKRTPIRKPQRGKSESIEPLPERRDPEPCDLPIREGGKLVCGAPQDYQGPLWSEHSRIYLVP